MGKGGIALDNFYLLQPRVLCIHRPHPKRSRNRLHHAVEKMGRVYKMYKKKVYLH